MWWVSESHPKGTGMKPAPTAPQPSHFCFLTGSVFICNVNKKMKKKITTVLFELETPGRQLGGKVWSWGMC